MASKAPTIKDKQFQNWIKGAIAQLYAKQGLFDFVNDEITQFRIDLLTPILTNESIPLCSTCTTENVLPCPTQFFCPQGRRCRVHDTTKSDKTPNRPCPTLICQDIREHIRREHRFNSPSWRFTDATKWSTNAFEIAKCFLPCFGYSSETSLANIDFIGILSVIINNKRFQTYMAADLNQRVNICTEAREVGRAIRHSSDLTLSDTDLEKYIDTLIDLLSDPKHLAADLTAQKAVYKLKQLKSNALIVTTADITTVLDDKCKDIKPSQSETALQTSNAGPDDAQEKSEETAEKNQKTLKLMKALLLHLEGHIKTGRLYKILEGLLQSGMVEIRHEALKDENILGNIDKDDFDYQNDLNRRWLGSRINGKGMEEFKSMCSNICSDIKEKSSDILHVWPAYDSNNNTSVEFIIVTKKEIDVKQLNLKYAAVVRLANTFSKETLAVTHAEKNDEAFRLSTENSEKIKNAINNHAENLMQRHRYLSVISGSKTRSRGFSNGQHKLLNEVCIVMYVHTKGKIPVDETELPQTIDDIAVDVREGEFQTYASAKEYQDHLRIGCQIECGNSGTLGCFLHHPKYGLCAITCAHVVLNVEEFHAHLGQTKAWKEGEKNVYQPIAENSNNYCGRVVETMLKSGDKTTCTSGVDLAVIKIDLRPPEGGHFPETGEDGEDIEYNSGHINPTVIRSHNLVTKFGMETNKTHGHVQFSDTVVKNIDWDQKYEVGNQQKMYTLHRQLEVQAAGSPGQFAIKGDSGAPVFITDVYGDWVCIGMVVGGIESNGNVVVTPVSSIMSELGVSEFQNFKVRKLEKHLATIEDKQDGMHLRLGSIEDKQDGINEDINQIKETLLLISNNLNTR